MQLPVDPLLPATAPATAPAEEQATAPPAAAPLSPQLLPDAAPAAAAPLLPAEASAAAPLLNIEPQRHAIRVPPDDSRCNPSISNVVDGALAAMPYLFITDALIEFRGSTQELATKYMPLMLAAYFARLLLLDIAFSRTLPALLALLEKGGLSKYSINSSVPYSTADVAARAALRLSSDLARPFLDKRISLPFIFYKVFSSHPSDNLSDTSKAMMVGFLALLLSHILGYLGRRQGLNDTEKDKGATYRLYKEIKAEFAFRTSQFSQFDTRQDKLKTGLKEDLSLLGPLLAVWIASKIVPSSYMESETNYLKLALWIPTWLTLLTSLSPSCASCSHQSPVQLQLKLIGNARELIKEIVINLVLLSCIQGGRVRNAQLQLQLDTLMKNIDANEETLNSTQDRYGNVLPSRIRLWKVAASHRACTDRDDHCADLSGRNNDADTFSSWHARICQLHAGICQLEARKFELEQDCRQQQHHHREGVPANLEAGFYPAP